MEKTTMSRSCNRFVSLRTRRDESLPDTNGVSCESVHILILDTLDDSLSKASEMDCSK